MDNAIPSIRSVTPSTNSQFRPDTISSLTMTTGFARQDSIFFESLSERQLDLYLRQYVDVVHTLLRGGIPRVGNLEQISPNDRSHQGRRYFPTVYHRLSLLIIDQIGRDIETLVKVIWRRTYQDEPPHAEAFDSASFVGRETPDITTDIRLHISMISQHLFARFFPTPTLERVEEKRQTIQMIINHATRMQYTAMELLRRGYEAA